MRKCKKEYFDNELEINKNNTKRTWDIISKMIVLLDTLDTKRPALAILVILLTMEKLSVT